MQEVAERTSFLIGADGTVRGSWRHDGVPNFDPLLKAAAEL
jgi:hypothetical protein